MKPRRARIWFVVVVAYFALVGFGLAWLVERQAGRSVVPRILVGITVAGLAPVLVILDVAQRRRFRWATAAQKREAAITRGGNWASFGTLLMTSGLLLSWNWLQALGLAAALGGGGMLWWGLIRAVPLGEPPEDAGEV